MSYVDTIRQWDQGLAFADKGDWVTALSVLCNIQDINSKIFFNIGSLHFINQDLVAAEKAFDKSICKDEHLAVAFFQRGIVLYKQQKFEESLCDFRKAFAELRANQLIDYKLLGLRFKLYACEVLHNMALTQAQLNQWEEAQESLLTALNLKTESKHNHIDEALESILKQKLFDLVEIQAGTLFRPNKHHVAELENKDYMGKAKVVASIIPKDDFSGFAPLQPQAEEVPVRPKFPEVLRALEGEPHSVLYEFVPETVDELAVLPGNIVFVLKRGTDNWASVIFNGKRGLVPYNFLEPLEITLSSMQGQGSTVSDIIPSPPSGEPPTRPERRDLDCSEDNKSATKTTTKDEKMREVQMCIIKVHFAYTLAICTIPGLPYSAVLQKIGKKLSLPIQKINLSYKKTGSDRRILIDGSEMENVWNCVKDGRLELWCDVQRCPDNEDNEKIYGLTKMVALHSYEASQPEDLEFQQGDVITVFSKVNEEWFEGQCNGKVGIFPALFVEEPFIKL